MDEQTAPEPKPRWAPLRVQLAQRDVPAERAAAAAPDAGVAPQLLGRVTHLQHVVASLVVRRTLQERGVELRAHMHASGLLFLVREDGARTSRGFVVASTSSMEPRPIWPMQLPLSVLEVAPIDWIVACSVPKTPALAAIGDGAADAYVLGWLAHGDLAKLPIITLQPHPDHEYWAKYRQAKNRQLRSIDEFPGVR